MTAASRCLVYSEEAYSTVRSNAYAMSDIRNHIYITTKTPRAGRGI